MPINQPSSESPSKSAFTFKDTFQRAKQEAAQVEAIFERDAERRQKIKADTSLSDEERKKQIEAIRETERSEVATLFDRFGILSKDEKVRAKQRLQGPVAPFPFTTPALSKSHKGNDSKISSSSDAVIKPYRNQWVGNYTSTQGYSMNVFSGAKKGTYAFVIKDLSGKTILESLAHNHTDLGIVIEAWKMVRKGA